MDSRRRSTRRNSLRYPGYDYSQAGCVFVTICTHMRQRLFGSVVDGEMWLSPQGVLAERYLLDIPDRVGNVIIDTVVVMPDHIHSIIMTGTDPEMASGAAVADIVHDFKIRVQAAWRGHVRNGIWSPYKDKLWQRSYHDRIIRNERDLESIREYIVANPGRWVERTEP